ncbi:MAG: hypothetical protein EU541_02285 [Promethearchaeota archaeon]|nr:MAG: hypothetical protein EU541_02285 [Candidatus Lokiarchaeota archaeon]
MIFFTDLTEYEIPSIPLWVLAWLFLVIGIISLLILLVYTRYGRDFSLKLSILTIVLSSVLLGFSIHFFLLNLSVY